MTDLTRRKALLAGTASVSALVSGCVGGQDDAADTGGDDERNGDENGNENDDENGTENSGENGDDTSVTSVEKRQLGTSSTPAWAAHDEDTVGVVYRYTSAEEMVDPVMSVLYDRGESIVSFIDETDFENEILLLVGTAGPDRCYNVADVTDLRVETGTLVGTAWAAQSSPGGESGQSEESMGCADAVSYPWSLVRVAFDGTPPDDVALEMTDGWGNEGTVTAPTDRGMDPAELDGFVSPDGEPAVVPDALACESDEFVRHRQYPDESSVERGEQDGFALRVHETSYELGETVTVSLTNSTGLEQHTGNRHRYNLQIKTADGWQDVRGSTESEFLPYTEEVLSHAPGDGFEWELQLTGESIPEGHLHEDKLTICPDLQPGRYRFLYWGPALAVEFDVTA